MSFWANDVNLTSISFNNEEVDTVYYNKFLVWAADAAPLSTKEDWNNLYELCKARQSGELAEWPDYIKIGMEGTVECYQFQSYYDNGRYKMEARVRLIGIDIDAPGTLTFQQIIPIISPGYNPLGLDDCEVVLIDEFVMPLEKLQWNLYSDKYLIYNYEPQKYWLPSLDEMGVVITYPDILDEKRTKAPDIPGEFTAGVGIPYQGFLDPNYRICFDAGKEPCYWGNRTMLYDLDNWLGNSNPCEFFMDPTGMPYYVYEWLTREYKNEYYEDINDLVEDTAETMVCFTIG